jgi:hypothetical protein
MRGWKYQGSHCTMASIFRRSGFNSELLMTAESSTKQTPGTSGNASRRGLLRGQYGLALTCWTLFALGAIAFFITGSAAVAEHDWPRFVLLLALSVAWTLALLIGVNRYYRGPDPGKVMARVSMLFLTLNLTNTLAVLSFF